MEPNNEKAAVRPDNDHDVERGSNKEQTTPQAKDHSSKAGAQVETVFDEAFLVTFGPDDPENPLNWSRKLKWGITAAVSSTGFVRIMVSTVRLRTLQLFCLAVLTNFVDDGPWY
jgi:hypothetical protein